MMNPNDKKCRAKVNPPDLNPGTPLANCIRCGTCCKKGGPSFHQADKHLIEKGLIHSKYLYTLRKGELAYDNVKECLMPVNSDIVKIKGKNNSWTCTFYDENENACRIYENRPVECRALKCWDTRELESIYAKNRLTRKDLIEEIEGLWGLIEDHQSRCDYATIQKLVEALESNKKKDVRREIVEIIRYDLEIRNLVVSKGGLDADMLEFLFGRPLVETIENFGLTVQKNGQKISLTPHTLRANILNSC